MSMTSTGRESIEWLLGWLDALRRRDTEALAAGVDPEAVWHGVREDLTCSGREEIVDTFLAERGRGYEIEALELLGGPDRVVLGVRRPDLSEIADVELYGQIHNVVELRDGRIVEIRDYPTRGEALRAAGMSAPAWR
jgi:ketosteroid isomerase-like protein